MSDYKEPLNSLSTVIFSEFKKTFGVAFHFLSTLFFGGQSAYFFLFIFISELAEINSALSISADSWRKLSATWEKISNRGRLVSCLAKCYYVGNLPNSTGQADYFSIHGLLLLNLLKGLSTLSQLLGYRDGINIQFC